MDKEYNLLIISKLRGLYKRAADGESNRQNIKFTLTPETVAMLSAVVPVGAGKYGSSFMELSARVLISLLGNGEDLEQVALELKKVNNSPYIAGNLKSLLRYLEG